MKIKLLLQFQKGQIRMIGRTTKKFTYLTQKHIKIHPLLFRLIEHIYLIAIYGTTPYIRPDRPITEYVYFG